MAAKTITPAPKPVPPIKRNLDDDQPDALVTKLLAEGLGEREPDEQAPAGHAGGGRTRSGWLPASPG